MATRATSRPMHSRWVGEGRQGVRWRRLQVSDRLTAFDGGSGSSTLA